MLKIAVCDDQEIGGFDLYVLDEAVEKLKRHRGFPHPSGFFPVDIIHQNYVKI